MISIKTITSIPQKLQHSEKERKKLYKREPSSFFCITSLSALVVSPKTLPYPPSDKSIIE